MAYASQMQFEVLRRALWVQQAHPDTVFNWQFWESAAHDPKMTSYLSHGVKAKMCETIPFVNSVGTQYIASRAQISVSPFCVSLSFFLASFTSLCHSLSLFLSYIFLVFFLPCCLLFIFTFLVFWLFFLVLLLRFCFMRRTTSKYYISKLYFHNSCLFIFLFRLSNMFLSLLFHYLSCLCW